MSLKTRIGVAVCSFTFVLVALTGSAAAQDGSRLAVDVEAGWVGFADDGVVGEGVVGTAARWYVTPRIGVGPEVSYISGRHHSHFIATGNVTFDLLSRAGRRVTPFLVAGGGLFQTRETFFNGDFTSSEGAFTAGGGVRASAGDRLAVGIDARVGWEAHVRVTGFVSVGFGDR
jgi:hypothetical protein